MYIHHYLKKLGEKCRNVFPEVPTLILLWVNGLLFIGATQNIFKWTEICIS